ncbi:MAG: hypothetical protein HKN23_03420, partial [Verrucomicrobiales bacterium]|nr:hypothetical protein [Verrucomicrobiales bacterium]
QIVSRRIKLARFPDKGSWWWRLKNRWQIIKFRIAGQPPASLRELLLAQTLTSNLQHLLRFEDRNSMAHSIEARVPFTDHRLVEWAFSRANEFKIREGWTKWVLRKAAADRVPDSVLWRSDKVGFETPDLRMSQRLLKESLRDLEKSEFLLKFLRPEAIRETVGKVDDGSATQAEAKLVWRWLVLESWERQFRSAAENDSTGLD